METQMSFETVNLNVYIVDKNWKVCRVINSTCKFFASASIPMIEITDKMLQKFIGRNVLYFYDTERGRLNFYCDNIALFENDVAPEGATITLELLEVGDEYVLLSPGFFINAADGRYRICDDGYLYHIIPLMTPEAQSGIDFRREFFDIYRRLYVKPVDPVESNVSDQDAKSGAVTIESTDDDADDIDTISI